MFLNGCVDSGPVRVDTSKLKFRAGDEISISSPFYSSCVGTITGYIYYYDLKDGPCYYVSFRCPNIGTLEDLIQVPESIMSKYKGK